MYIFKLVDKHNNLDNVEVSITTTEGVVYD